LTDTPLVLHGASAITPEYVKTINKFGGMIENALGVSEETLSVSL
jgi:fructose-bisphosphate aldolase class II